MAGGGNMLRACAAFHPHPHNRRSPSLKLVRVLCVAMLAAAGSFGVTGFASADEFCEASWYGGEVFHGEQTANQEQFDENAIDTVAHKTLPFNTWVEITNLENGEVIKARVNDRGPFHPGRCVDLPKRAAVKLGFKDDGVADVRVRRL